MNVWLLSDTNSCPVVEDRRLHAAGNILDALRHLGLGYVSFSSVFVPAVASISDLFGSLTAFFRTHINLGCCLPLFLFQHLVRFLTTFFRAHMGFRCSLPLMSLFQNLVRFI